MIMTVAELRQFVTTDEEDQALEARLQALELLVRAYTNNNFQKRAFRAVAVAMADHKLLIQSANPFNTGDTLQITESELNAGLVTVSASSNDAITVKESLYDEGGVVITKVVYPADVKLGVANMLKWQLENGDKVGVSSETISRHSVTYFNMDGDNSTMGFPKAVLGFLRPYMKARFGQGLRV
nr:MAG TPA: head to tail adaptor [Caudoviricetes sp.]